MWFSLLISTIAVLLFWDYRVKKRRIEILEKSKINGPGTFPFIGCGSEVFKIGAETLIPYIGNCFQKYGNTFRLWVLNELQIYTKNIKHFETILSSTTLLEKGELYDLLEEMIGDGLLLSYGKKWHARRKIFTPAFHFKVLEYYVTIFDNKSEIMVKKLEPKADGTTVIDMLSVICLTALDVMTEAAMGVQVNAQLDTEFPYVKALKRVVYTQPSRMLKFNQRRDWIFMLTAPFAYRQVKNDIKIMHNFTTNVIEQRREDLEQSIANGTYKPITFADDNIGTKQQMNLLDILLQSKIDGKSLTNEDIREEVDTFMFEGDDTTTSGISHALYCIARHPDVQKKLFEEILQVIGNDKTAPITITHLQELKYMECVLKETLRMHPPVPAIGRKTDKDIELDGMTIPANSSIYMILYWAHRDPSNFPDPDTFKPERFEETTANDNMQRNPFAYTPFSAGPKNCIGQKFAMLEMKTLVSKMLRYFELLPLGENVKPMFNFILRSPNGINVGLKRRNY